MSNHIHCKWSCGATDCPARPRPYEPKPMSLQEEVEEIIIENIEQRSKGIYIPSAGVKIAINKVLDAAVEAIQDNPHKSPIEAITDMRREGGKV